MKYYIKFLFYYILTQTSSYAFDIEEVLGKDYENSYKIQKIAQNGEKRNEYILILGDILSKDKNTILEVPTPTKYKKISSKFLLVFTKNKGYNRLDGEIIDAGNISVENIRKIISILSGMGFKIFDYKGFNGKKIKLEDLLFLDKSLMTLIAVSLDNYYVVLKKKELIIKIVFYKNLNKILIFIYKNS